MKKHVVCFRPTEEMMEIIKQAKKDTGMETSEVMRTIMSEYMRFVRKYHKDYR